MDAWIVYTRIRVRPVRSGRVSMVLCLSVCILTLDREQGEPMERVVSCGFFFFHSFHRMPFLEISISKLGFAQFFSSWNQKGGLLSPGEPRKPAKEAGPRHCHNP